MKLNVRHAGFLTSVQDLGRRGFRRFGVSVGGALDPHALRIANLLVENDEGAAGLEITLGGFRAQFDDHRLVAWCGGGFDVRIGSTALPSGHVGRIQSGEELVVNPPRIGCRAWVGISGWSAPGNWTMTAKEKPILGFVRGCEWAAFDPSAHQAFVDDAFTVSPDSNRMGARLEGSLLWRTEARDLISWAGGEGASPGRPKGRPM